MGSPGTCRRWWLGVNFMELKCQSVSPLPRSQTPLWTVPSRWAGVSSTVSGCWIFCRRLMSLHLMPTLSTTGPSYNCWWVGVSARNIDWVFHAMPLASQTYFWDPTIKIKSTIEWSNQPHLSASYLWVYLPLFWTVGQMIIHTNRWLDNKVKWFKFMGMKSQIIWWPLKPLAKVWWMEKPTPGSWHAYMEGACEQPRWEGDLWAFHCPTRLSGVFVQQKSQRGWDKFDIHT